MNGESERGTISEHLLDSVAGCLDPQSVQALATLRMEDAARARLDRLAERANEGQLTPDEAQEYDQFIELGDIIATLRLKAERRFRTQTVPG